LLLAVSTLLVCRPCHQQIADRWAASPMGRSFGLVDAAKERPGRFSHAASRTDFRIAPRDGLLELLWSGHRQRLDFFIGSRRVGRSFGFSENGYLYQAPRRLLRRAPHLGHGPGYENDAKADLSRPIHAGVPVLSRKRCSG
jgi:hypothetical protein